MRVKLLSEHHLGFFSLKGGCTGTSESILVKFHILEITCHGSYIDVEKYYMYATYNSLCAQISQNVTYWYQFFTRCKELVPIFHSVKFVKCEICGSTGLQCHLSPLKDIVCKLTYRR